MRARSGEPVKFSWVDRKPEIVRPSTSVLQIAPITILSYPVLLEDDPPVTGSSPQLQAWPSMSPPTVPRLTDLPNEILVSILTPFLATELLRLAVVCRRFHSVIVRILHFRIVLAPSLPEYKLILEAYHPSKRYFDPHLFCTYLHTDGFSTLDDGTASLYDIGCFAKMGLLYSRFRPERPVIAGTMPLRRIAGAAPTQAQNGSTVQPIYRNAGDGGTERIVHAVHLDPEELFGQFCAYSSLVRLGPRRGVFLGTVPIVKPNQGTMRVWKAWLCERAREARRRQTEEGPITPGPEAGQDPDIMWTDYRRNVGIKVGVSCREDICYDESADMDTVPLSFTLEIQELVVRTTHLMLAVETSTHESESRSGRALIFGNFTMPQSDTAP